MSDPFDGLVVVAAGPGAYQRALIEAVRLYGPGIELNQVGWSDELVEFEVVDE